MMFKFQLPYFVPAIALLLVEIAIAVFVKDAFVRPYVGDYLVVILLYCMLKSVVVISPIKAAIIVFLFALAVEFTQYFNLAAKLGFAKSSAGTVILGSSFEWLDILAYALGLATVLLIEQCSRKRIKN
jgi:hypothetical protein